MKSGTCYCDQWELKPQALEKKGIPRGYCGLCDFCKKPGHTRHFPGVSPSTGSWCRYHYWLLAILHPCGIIGTFLYLGVFLLIIMLLVRFIFF